MPKKGDVSYSSSYLNRKFRYRKDVKDLLVEEDKKNKHARMLLEVDHESVVGVKKELILLLLKKNPRIRLTILNFEEKCFNTFIKKLLKTVPSTNDESNLEEVTEECLTSQSASAITINFLPVDTTHEELS